MGIQVYSGHDVKRNCQVFQILVFGKGSRVVQIGNNAVGKRVAIRSFKIGLGWLKRGESCTGLPRK